MQYQSLDLINLRLAWYSFTGHLTRDVYAGHALGSGQRNPRVCSKLVNKTSFYFGPSCH